MLASRTKQVESIKHLLYDGYHEVVKLFENIFFFFSSPKKVYLLLDNVLQNAS
jgi:hypothetical protein